MTVLFSGINNQAWVSYLVDHSVKERGQGKNVIHDHLVISMIFMLLLLAASMRWYL